MGAPLVHIMNFQCALGGGIRKREGNIKKLRKSLRADVVSCLKVRIGFPTGAKSLRFQSLGAQKSRKGFGTAANTGKNVVPGHLPVFCRCPEICSISANQDDLQSRGVSRNIKELMIAGTRESAQRIVSIWDPKGDRNSVHNV